MFLCTMYDELVVWTMVISTICYLVGILCDIDKNDPSVVGLQYTLENTKQSLHWPQPLIQ